MSRIDIDFKGLSLNRRQTTVILGIDASASMNSKHPIGSGLLSRHVTRMSVACDGACRVIDSLSAGDVVQVLSFGDEITDVAKGSTEISASSKAQIKQCIKSIQAAGGTKLFDTILAGCKIVLERAAAANLLCRALSQDAGTFWFCVLTDGEDTRSSSKLQDVVAVLQKLNSELGSDLMKLMIIGVKLSPLARQEMAQIATAGGAMVTFSDAQKLDDVTTAFQEFVIRVEHTRAQVRCLGANHMSPTREITPSKMEIRPGSLVAVKSSVSTPAYSWGMYNNRNMHGLVVAVEADGDVLLQLGLEPDGPPTGNLWRGRLAELEVIDDGTFTGARRGFWTGKLQLGQAVRVLSRLTERGEVGYVRSFLPNSGVYVCDFPSCDGWKGREQDLEVEAVATLVRPGEKVRVRHEVTSPRGGWGNVATNSVGTVTSIRYDGVCTVNFPGQSGWKCYLDELETIDRPPTLRLTRRKFQKNAIVTLKGLNSRKGAPLNGKTARILDFDAEDPKKYIVDCISAPKGGSLPINIHEDKMMILRCKHTVGRLVRLKGIVKRPELNDEVAKVEEFDAMRGRYQVWMLDQKVRAWLLAENLEVYTVPELF